MNSSFDDLIPDPPAQPPGDNYDFSALPDQYDLSGLPDQYDLDALPDQPRKEDSPFDNPGPVTGRFVEDFINNYYKPPGPLDSLTLTETPETDYIHENIELGMLREVQQPIHIVSPEELSRLEFRQGSSLREKMEAAAVNAKTDDEFFHAFVGVPVLDMFQRFYSKTPPGKVENIWAMSQVLDLPINFVADNYDELNRRISEDYTDHLMNLITTGSMIFAPPAALSAAGRLVPGVTKLGRMAMAEGSRFAVVDPLYYGRVFLGLAGMEFQSAAAGLARSRLTEKPFKPFYLTDLLPETADTMTRTLTELIDMGAKAKIAHKGMGMLGILWDRLTTDTIIQNGLPKTIYVDPSLVERIFRGQASLFENEMWRSLNISGEELRAAKGLGFQLEIPLARVVVKSDKPWFSDLKEAFGVSPYVERTTELSGERLPAKVTPVAGLLEEPGKPMAEPEMSGPKVSETSAPKLEEFQNTDEYLRSLGLPKGWVPSGKNFDALTPYVKASAEKYGVPENILRAVIWKESNFHPDIVYGKRVGGSGDSGAMQLIPGTAEAMGVKDVFDPAQNIDGGARYLSTLYQKFGDWGKAVAAYNSGSANRLFTKNPDATVEQAPNYSSYVSKVMDTAQRFGGKVPEGKPSAAVPETFTRDKFVAALDKNPKIPAEQKGAFIEITDAIATSWAETYNRTPEEWYSEKIAGLQTSRVKDVGLAQYAGEKAVGFPDASGKFSSLFDKKTRFEIDDSDAHLLVTTGSIPGTPLKDVLKHDVLYENYPDLRNLRTRITIEPGAAADARIGPMGIEVKAPDAESARKMVLHETQHWIQVKEQFAKGGAPVIERVKAENPEAFKSEVARIKNEKPTWSSVQTLIDGDVEKTAAYSVYLKMAGEIEARDTAARADLTSEQRSKSPPYSSEDISPDRAILMQGRKKGAAEVLEDGRTIIHLFQKADISTLIHETAHILEEMLTPEDSAIVNDWLGLPPETLGKDRPTAKKEQFARAFEAYIMEGRAPSSKLREVFAKLRRWMLDIYRSVRNLGVELSDEVRAVFDRLLSTEEERRANVLYQLLDDYPPPSSTPIPAGTIQEYEQIQAEALRRAVQEVELDQRKALLKAEAGWRKRAMEMYEAEPVFQIKQDIAKRGGLNRADLGRDWDKDTITALVRSNPGLITKNGSLHLDTYATETNFESGDALMQALIDFPSRQAYVEGFVSDARKAFAPEIELNAADYQLAVLDKEIEIFNEMLKGSTKDWKNVARPGIKRSIIDQTSSVKVGDFAEVSEYHNLKAAMKMAGKASRQAFRAGKTEQALKDKIQQAEIAQRLRDRLAIRKEYQQIKGQLKKALGDKKVEWDYREQMIQILAPFRIQAKRIKPSGETLSQFVARKEAEGDAILFDTAEIMAISGKKLHELTMEELRTLRDTVVHIHYVGRAVKEFLGQYSQKTMDEAAAAIGQTAYDTAIKTVDLAHPLAEKQKTAIDVLTGKYREFQRSLLKPEFIFRHLDGGQEFGPAWVHLWQPIKKAEDEETVLAEKIFGRYREVLEPHLKKLREWRKTKINVPNTGFSVTKEQAMSVYANTIHKDNLRHLRLGFAIDRPPLSDDEIRAIVKLLTPEERAFVDTVIDDVISQGWEPLSEAYRTLTGVPLKKVDGRYFPLKFDPRYASERIAESDAQRQVQGYFKEFFPASLEKGMTKERKGGSQPIRTDFFNVVAEHLTDTIRYASYSVPLRDVLKLMSHPVVKQAIRETMGEEALAQIKPWLKETVNPGTKPVLAIDKWINRIRGNYTYFVMGWRLTTALAQPTAYANTINELGFLPAMKGLNEYVKSPSQWHDFILEKSPFMRVRTQSFDRDLNDIVGKFDPVAMQQVGTVKATSFYLISLLDRLAAEPTWLSAYRVAMGGEVPNVPSGDEAAAIEYADGVTRRTQGSGMPKDLAAIQRGRVFEKMLVSQFYSFFSAVYNQLWEAWSKRVRGGTWFDFIGSYWWLIFVPAVINSAVQERRIPKDGADLFKMLGKSVALYQAGTIPIVRDAANVTLGGYDYRAGAFGSAFDEVQKVWQAAGSQRNRGQRLAIHGLKLTGIIFGFPPDQAIIAMQGALDLASGKTKNPARLFFRETYPKK